MLIFCEQDLPNATGDDGARERMKSMGVSAAPDQHDDHLSKEAVGASLAALGGSVVRVCFGGAGSNVVACERSRGRGGSGLRTNDTKRPPYV